MKQTRTQKSIHNVVFSIGTYMITVIVSFINRSYFISLLSADYLGFNGLINNILSFLSLAELGVGAAINFTLYEPLSCNDKEKIKSIMYLYRRMYMVIGAIILIAGYGLSPVLPFLIKDMPANLGNIYLYYILFVTNVGISYFFSYKRSLIICDQKEYVVSVINVILTVVMNIAQICILKLTKNYALYLSVMVFFTFVENIVISLVANRLYPYIVDKGVRALEKNYLRQIKKNIFAMMLHKIGNVVVFASDNIIISKFVGLHAVGLYSNYILVRSPVNSIMNRIFDSILASLGNLVVSSDKVHSRIVFDRLLFFNVWLYGFCSCWYLCVIQPFIELWIGETYKLPDIVIAVMTLNFYLTGIRKAVLSFRNAIGLFWNDRKKPVIESILNIVFSIPLAIKYGIIGVVLGTILSTLVLPFWYEAWILFKNYFEQGFAEYMFLQIKYGLQVLAGVIMSVSVSMLFGNVTGIIRIIIEVIVVGVIMGITMILFSLRNESFQYYYRMVKDTIMGCKKLKHGDILEWEKQNKN